MQQPDNGWNAWATGLTREVAKVVGLATQNQVDIRELLVSMARLETLVSGSSDVKDKLETCKSDINLLKFQAKLAGALAGTITGIIGSIVGGVIMWIITK